MSNNDNPGARTESPRASGGGSRFAVHSLGAFKRWLVRTAEVLHGSAIDGGTYKPGQHAPLLSFEERETIQEVERYWLNAPYAMAVVTRDPDEFEFTYHVIEPSLNALETELLARLSDEVRKPILYRGDSLDDSEAVLMDELRRRLEEYGVRLDSESFHKLFYYLHRDYLGFGKIDPLMHDPHVEDISCNGYDLPIYVYHDEYLDIETNLAYSEGELDQYVVHLAQRSGRHISAGDPIVETTLPDGSRAELSLGEQITPRGSAFNIRRYAPDPFTPVDLLQRGTFSLAQMAYLWLAIENNKNLIFAGGTASGKTTSMNAISMFIPPRSKVITIEDTRELTLYHDNWFSSVTRELRGQGQDVTMFDLLRAALRHRPEYIIVGEVRGEEAMTLFQAMNTGHTTYSTMHADSVQTVINRLENDPINVPRAMIQSLDILCIQHLTRIDDERIRRNRLIAEINDIDSRTGELRYAEKYNWRPKSDEFSDLVGTSQVLEEIREEHNWSMTTLRRELRNRRWVLEYLAEKNISDYRHFTAMVDEYYAAPDAVLKRINRAPVDVPG